jgi:hypothetical protein
MQRKPGIASATFLICLLFLQGFAPVLNAQTGPPPPTPQELDQLLSPVALYPDPLLAQITTASTNPQEILDVTNWLAKNPSLTGPALTEAAQKQGYDPAFLALVTFPRVLQMMADNIDEYAAIGLAVTANQAGVADSVQRLRAQAYSAGALRTTPEQKVEVQQTSGQPIYVIQPANPEVVYVPVYNPTVVYVAPPPTVVATNYVSFGVGVGIAALVYSNQPWGWGGWGWGWGGTRSIYYNRGPWGGVWVGGYRPPVFWYRPRPPYYVGYPGYGGNWGYRPPNYRPPYPARPPVYRPPGSYPGRPGYRPPLNGGRPIAKPYPTNRPATNNKLPATRPAQPTTRPPLNQTRPAIQPIRPSNPTSGGKDSPIRTRPAQQPAQTRPAPKETPQNRPAPQPRPTNPDSNRPGKVAIQPR